jgi:hypothetical protein
VCPYLLDVVIRKSASILKLLSSEDQSLLVRGNSLLVLDLGLDIIDRIGGLDLKGDGLARKGLDEAVDFVSLLVACGETDAWGSLHLHCKRMKVSRDPLYILRGYRNRLRLTGCGFYVVDVLSIIRG